MSFSLLLKFLGIQTLVFINFKMKNIYIFFKHAFRKKLALIILVQRLHSIITYARCNSSLKKTLELSTVEIDFF